ncbi:hypothetical protein M409DRAFT_17372 [Zasmidium cellare ATCC 36951]|uniref:Cupin 2 conserved barrel domain-containing protein n=1 Tax=Zasmidium cellare ATCC 36951 TaxID=1080233 RepID=A0A6A6CYG5_ZASCE|nr:uncharacterized protein M409DRAFT_17372 [Zasmidium cellare ATCC 36951]KAF2172131.1 hypothetical protein M409DRAFT_17372 [Zasmidium cellare ATCC 36951]
MLSNILLAATAATTASALSPLFLDTPPSYSQPYAIKRFAPAKAVAVGQQIYRFPVTGAASDGKFSLLSTSAPSSNDLGVLPHQHYLHFENFFCLEGRFQLWTSKNDSENGRLLTAGDYGAVPPNTTHTFQLLDPFTEMVGAIGPGGFEDLFFFLVNSNYTAATRTPYVPSNASSAAGSGSSSAIITSLQSYDVWAQLSYFPRRDFVNGSAPSTSGWHSSPNSLPQNDHTPYFVAKDYGPKYLHTSAFYQIVQPLVTPAQAGAKNFTQGTITISSLPSNTTLDSTILPDHTAFEVLSGELIVEMEGETLALVIGDVVFIPGGTAFKYYSSAAFTKFLYVAAGRDTLDQRLIAEAKGWGYPVFPTAWP